MTSVIEAVPMYMVPCDGCTRCCHNDAVRLLAGDDLSQYQTEPHPYMPEARMLAHKPNGDCLYLGDEGCTIHDTRPQMCREMDCRLIAQVITWAQARKMEALGTIRMDVWQRGKELLRMGSNVEFRGDARLHCAASPGTQGWAQEGNDEHNAEQNTGRAQGDCA